MTLGLLAALLPAGGAAAELTKTLQTLSLREIGPALMGGRIADIAVDPTDPSRWFVAVGSGGVFRTENAGVTWTAVFDDQASYSVGAVAIDPERPNVVWVGTGENVSGRHVSWGDGLYKSLDGGESWSRVGLERSEHIGDIVFDPRDSNTVYVAAEGPLWSSGGERGLYKTTDGGTTWQQVLSIDEDTGVTDVEIDPRQPDILYAATYQRRRKVWSLLAGGPGSGIHKSTDGGASWRKLARGLPSGEVGKIGLAISPADPDVVYATLEASPDSRGFYRSRDRGESWEKRSSYLSNGTGPHYYQEIVASPHDVDDVYQMDVFYHVTRDGGATFEVLGDGRQKHSDNHALWIDPEDSRHLLSGTDAGLYESFDDGQTWRHFPNLPVSQFYKLALDSSEPFYRILGGAQDLGTLLGPSRTAHTEGIRNQDWTVPLGADGYACAFDPEDPDTMYLEWQVGRLQRYDHRSGELIDIQPVPAPGEPAERFNWDAPVIVSRHAAKRLYFGSQRVWRSDDRGDSWSAISEDLTGGANRYELPIGGRVRSVDALYDNGAMSLYSTTTALAESPHVEGLLYVGTDDGLIQVTEDGGASWRQAAALPGVPERSFVNDVVASEHQADTVYAVVDAHKEGDYRPLLFASDDRGRSWRSIAGDLPERGIVWGLVQDHEEPGLLFAGTEFGLWVTLDGGASWHELTGGMPTISVRDLALQRRDDDLVAATFGRGFYVLDDYSPLRDIARGALEEDAHLFPTRDAWSYVPYVPSQARGMPTLGSDSYRADNPPFGATFTYFLKESETTGREDRREREKELSETGKDIPFPGWETLRLERTEQDPRVVLSVRDAEGRTVRTLFAPASEGLHRVAWDLRWPPASAVRLETPGFRPPWASDPQGPLVSPGRYQVELALETEDGRRTLSEARSFEVRAVPGAGFEPPEGRALAAFREKTLELVRRVEAASGRLGELDDRVPYLRAAYEAAPSAPAQLSARITAFERELAAIALALRGDPARRSLDEPSAPTVSRRVYQVAGGHWNTTQAPTATQRASLEVAAESLRTLEERIAAAFRTSLAEIERELELSGAPYTPGRRLEP